MLWKKDRLRPTQPYFVFDTEGFRQEIYLRQGISHFFTFHMGESNVLRIVPDGCIDLFFEFDDAGARGYACGTKLVYSLEERTRQMEVFGIRFMPGVQPEMLDVTMRELLERRIPIESILKGDDRWLQLLAAEDDFYQRIRVFLEYYTKAENRKARLFGKRALVQSVKQMVYDSDGKIKVYEMADNTGYSERYINKVFLEEMGFSPKTFCKIIQFQRALEFMNYGAPDKMTDAAVFLGYYDQPQFIHDFTKYAGTTPGRYLKMVEERNYQSRIRETRHAEE